MGQAFEELSRWHVVEQRKNGPFQGDVQRRWSIVREDVGGVQGQTKDTNT